jgi:glutamyl-tRNA synthetase
MVGDFVLIRSNGMPTYNFCCAVDDFTMKISHVIRAEEHLNNTLRQLMIFDALGAIPPEYAHVSLLIGEDRQKLSKRHGATSVAQYREMNYLPGALLNYLCLLGWSHPKEKEIFEIPEIIPLFNLDRFSKGHALYDIAKLNYFNSQHLRLLSPLKLMEETKKALPKDSPFHEQSDSWKINFLELFKDKVTFLAEMDSKVKMIFDSTVHRDAEFDRFLGQESIQKIKEYLLPKLDQLSEKNTPHLSATELNLWMNEIKDKLGIKGRDLFMGFRALLTGSLHGPDLQKLMELTPLPIVLKRIKGENGNKGRPEFH